MKYNGCRGDVVQDESGAVTCIAEKGGQPSALVFTRTMPVNPTYTPHSQLKLSDVK
jgi:hypothetical protein